MNDTKTATIKYPTKFENEVIAFAKCMEEIHAEGGTHVSCLVASSNKVTDFVKNKKAIHELRTMYPNKSFWKAFKKLKGKYFWIGAAVSAIACGATYFVTKKRRKKKFTERMLKVQETYSEDPVAMALELVGVMQHELKGLGYHFEELHDLFEEDV